MTLAPIASASVLGLYGALIWTSRRGSPASPHPRPETYPVPGGPFAPVGRVVRLNRQHGSPEAPGSPTHGQSNLLPDDSGFQLTSCLSVFRLDAVDSPRELVRQVAASFPVHALGSPCSLRDSRQSFLGRAVATTVPSCDRHMVHGSQVLSILELSAVRISTRNPAFSGLLPDLFSGLPCKAPCVSTHLPPN